jgi:hypothetical protein
MEDLGRAMVGDDISALRRDMSGIPLLHPQPSRHPTDTGAALT